MSESIAFLLYASIFRLAIVAVGALSIWLGYRLFIVLSGDGSSGGTGGETEAEAKFGELQFGIRRAAPGTCFAIFGAALVSVMVAQGLPEFSREQSRATDGERQALAMKGRAGESPSAALSAAFTQQLDVADALLRQGDRAGAATAYARALAQPGVTLGSAARAFNQLAWLEHLDGNHRGAVALARVAVGLDPGNSEYLDTLAQAIARSRDAPEAAELSRVPDATRP